MKLRIVNYFLLVLCLFLILNLFFPIRGISKGDDLGCSLNGEFVEDVNLCCHEMQKFLDCSEGKCETADYKILSNKGTLDYCRKRGYDVKF